MKDTIILLALLFCIPAAHAQTCPGPAPCGWEPVVTTSPEDDELCLGGNIGCIPVTYAKIPDADGGWYAMARSVVEGIS